MNHMIKATIKSLTALSAMFLLVAAFGAGTAQAQTCMEDQFGGAANCTANDNTGYSIAVAAINNHCDEAPVGTANVDLDVTFAAGNATTRYDLGVFIAQDGGDALTGDCARAFIPSGTPGSSDVDGDVCQDQLSDSTVVVNVASVSVSCTGPPADSVSVCVSWGNSATKVDSTGGDGMCEVVDELKPGTSSKCICGFAQLGNLPVELVSFDALLEGSNAVLTWETASEANNAGFAIEHSDNGGPFEEVAFVPGVGNSLNTNSYTYTVNDVSVGLHRFRLKQVDFDGAFTYSAVVEVTSEVPGTHVLSDAYPNPFNPTTSFSLAVSHEQNVTIDVYDMLGRQVSQLFRGTLESNVARTFSVSAANWTSGTYTVVVEGETFRDSRNLVLLK